MIARSDEWSGQTMKYCFAVVLNIAGFAVHELLCADYAASERSADGLMSETNAQNRDLSCKALNDWHADAGFLWCAGTR